MAKDASHAPIANPDTPPAREPETAGFKGRKRDYPVPDDDAQAPTAPKLSGGAAAAADPLNNKLVNRNTEDIPRQAGKTPRPTDRPGE